MSAWHNWDGRRLRWRVENSTFAEVDLCIDGVRFERVPAQGERDFALSPSGNARMEFLLRVNDNVVAAPWRVLLGSPAVPGIDAWHGAIPKLQPLPARLRLPPATAHTTIVVPIYNSPQLVQRCIDAVLRWTQGPARLILIDDASPDAAIAPLLDRYEHRANILVRRNAQNLGFTRTANLGMALAGSDDIVLLNADTEVGPRWLDMLRATAYADEAIGTVTPVSDNAGAFSVPELEQYCPIPQRWTLVEAQRALLHHAGGCLPQLPTGNGFCLFIKHSMLDRVGLLDADAFPCGYGEENDLCQRAERIGLRHVIAGNVLVRHARSASFGHERRTALGAQGMAVLRARYPDYETKVGATLFSFARRVLDYRVRRLYAGIDNLPAPRPRVLGGTRMDTHCESVAPPSAVDPGWLLDNAIELVQAPEWFAAARAAGVPVMQSGLVENAAFPAWRATASFPEPRGDFA